MKTFQIGDKVRIIADTSYHGRKIGSIVMIAKIEPGKDYYYESSGYVFRSKEIELVSKLSHNDQIRSYLESGKSITAIEALELFGCFRLASRIFELKEEGMNIPKPEKIKTASGKYVARYSLIK